MKIHNDILQCIRGNVGVVFVFLRRAFLAINPILYISFIDGVSHRFLIKIKITAINNRRFRSERFGYAPARCTQTSPGNEILCSIR